jgi:integrase
MLSFNKDPQDINFSIENNATVPKEQTSIEKTINSYIEEQLAGGNWETDTERERRKCFKALIDILGADFPTESLTKKLGREIKDIISGLPIRWTTQKETKNLSILEASKDKKLPKISVKTVNEYMSAYSTYGKWLEQRDYLDKNPFSYLTTKITSDEKARDDFSIDEMRLILNAIEHDKIKNSRKKSRYWGIMIAAYTGMRREEIAQLYVSDIKQENDIYYIDINKNTPDKRLKNKSSKRHMPIHQTIIDKGFIEYVEGLKANGIERIFPDLKAGEKHRYGRNLGEWFNGKFLKQLGIKTDKNAFHSFRHTVTTQLFEIGTQDSLVKKIRGSSVANDPTFNNYDHSTRLGLMKEALERLPY